jgi:hypothetical protein
VDHGFPVASFCGVVLKVHSALNRLCWHPVSDGQGLPAGAWIMDLLLPLSVV